MPRPPLRHALALTGLAWLVTAVVVTTHAQQPAPSTRATKAHAALSLFAQVPPRVEYELTAFGRSLEPFLLGLRDWGDRYKRRLLRVQAAVS